MAKVVLNKRPETFNLRVTVQQLDGQDGTVNLKARNRTRTELAKLKDEYLAEVQATIDAAGNADEQKVTWAELVGRGVESDAGFVMRIAEGWDLDDEFSKENVIRLIDGFGGAGKKIISGYEAAIHDGRLGN
ncbi:phage tail assembly chaperone [Xenophilus sp. Marseille-Q4582]|uniref:phage tail assembly chaperone n=1 Tax=Xenophilus sp. Marseille-Q4582 TaxID=2866600 RepID=UPI001CE43CED|nr:phage tail assembly chaperone [Xenophilus sp. Marseille-Q4582]